MNPFRKKDQSEPAQATQVQPTAVYSSDPNSLDSSLESTNIEAKNLALQERNEVIARASERHQQIEQRAMRQSMVRYGVLGLIFLVAIGLVFFRLHAKPTKANLNSVNQKYSTQKLQLGDISDKTGVSSSKDNSVDVNGQLYVNSSLVLSPVSEPGQAVAGQLYYDADSGELRFYDGASFNTLTTSNNVVISLGGTSGAIDLGSGLAMVDNQLVNTGVNSISAGNNISVSDDGAGNLTIDSLANGSGNVSTDSDGTPGRLVKFTGAQTIADSLIGESGSTVTVNGSLQVTGALSLGTALSVGQGGTGLTSLSANQLVFASSASTIGQLSNGAGGQCLVSNGAGAAPSFQNCPGGGSAVASVNGQTGVISLNNASGSGGFITIDNAKADGSTKGIATFSSSDFSDNGGGLISIKTGGITTTEILDGTIGNIDLAANSVNSGNIVDGTVTGTDIAINTVTNNNLATNLNASNIVGVGTLTSGTWQGSVIQDAYVADNLTISSAGTVDWQALNNYPAACAAGQAITQLGDTVTCGTFAAGSGSGNYIQNQNSSDQAADFRISGTGRANTSIQTPLLDTATAVSLNIGTTNATQINLNKNVVIAAQQALTFVGGTTAQRPASPTEGMLYYDTSTHQLLQFNGTKWVSDRSSNTKIVAPSTASQSIKDSADYVANGTNDESVINSALTAATGGTVLLLPGTYITTGTVLIPNNTTLAGSGRYNTIIKFNVGSATDNLIENSDSSTGDAVSVHDLRLDDSLGTGGTQNAISFTNLNSGTTGVRNNITNIYIGANVWPYGNAVVLTNSSINRLSDIYVGQTGADIVVDIDSAVQSMVNNFLLSNVTASNIAHLSDNNLGDVSVIGGEVNNFTNNFVGNVTVSGTATNSAAILTFNDNVAMSLTVDGTLNPTALVQVSGNTFTPQTGGQDGIKLIASDIAALVPGSKTNIVNNTFLNEGTTGYAINIDSTTQNVYLSNNTLGGMAINNAASDTVLGGQVNSAGNYLIQPAGTVELLKNTNVTGNITATGSISSSGLITAGNGLTVSSGTITFSNLTGGSSKCLTLDASNHVGVATCATGSGASPNLQNVYDNSGTIPNITLNNANGGINIQDASTAVSGNLLAVKNNAGTVTYFNVTSSGVTVTGTVTGTNFSGNGSGLTNVDAATLNGQAGSYYTNAGNISSGTLNDSRLSTNVALYNNATSNFTGSLQHNGNTVCDTSGNCTGVSGGAVGGSGSANTIAMFTGSGFTIGNSMLSQDAGATTLTVSGDLSVTGGVTANSFSGDGTNVTNVNAAKLNGNDSTFYTNASNLSSGTLMNGRLSGSYTGVTGTGALAAGSIASGFGTIATTNTITGSTLNGTIGVNTGAGAGTQRIDASGNLLNIGTISTSGLITGGNGLTISAGTVTLSGLSGSASTCLTLDASSHVGTATCAVGSGASPTLQNVYDNSGATPNILLASLGKGVSIQDAAVSVGGNLLAIKNNANTVTYLGVTTAGTSISGNLTASGTITFSGKTAGLGIFDNSGVLTSGSIDLGLLPTYISGTLPIGNGGTGGTSFGPTNSVIYYDGSKLASTNAGTTGQCLLATTGGAPSFGTCTGAGGVSSVTATTTQTGALTFASNASQVSVSNSGGTFNFTLPQSIATTSDVQFHNLDATNLLKTGGTTRIDASGNLSNIGTISTSGLITGGNGLTVSAGTVTLNNLTGGASTCLTLNGSNVVGTATCATGSGSTPTLQNVYDNSGATPNILLASLGKGLTIQDASSSVGGNLLAIKNNANTTTYFDVTTSGADITGSLSVSSNVTLSNLTGGAAAGKCLTTDNSGVLQLTSCLGGGSGGSGGVSSLNGLSGSINLANATAAGSTVTINKAKADGATLGLAAFGSANFTDNGSGVITIKTGGVTTTEIADGTVADADLSTGTFTHVTGTGALAVGSIASGFGNIVTTNTITGNVINGTNGVYSGGTAAGDLRIDASGNLSNIGTITTSGLVTAGNGLTVGAGTISFNNLTGGSGQCLTLDASHHVGVSTCATGAGSNPTLQNVYDNSTTSPDVILSATGGGLVIQDAGTTVGNLLTVSNSGNSTQYLNITASGLSAAGTITFSGLASATGGVVFANGSGALSVTSNAGTTGQCLLSNGSGNAPSFATCPGNGALPTNGSATDNTISKFSNSATKLTDSQIRDDGTHVTIGNSGTSTGGLFNVGASDQFQVSSAGAITAVGVNAGAGLLQGSAGLTISGGTITLSSVSAGTAAGCLALDASNHVVSTSCAPGTGGASTNNYILNQATIQSNANFFIQGAASSVTAVVQGASGGGDIADFNTSGGATVTSIDASGHIKYVASGTSGATLVCQNAAGQLAGCSSSYQTALTFNNGLTNTAGTVGLGGTLTSATTLAAGNANSISITSDLSGGARSSYALNITQANDAANSNSTGLVNISNADTSSIGTLVNISQVSSGNGINIAGITTGNSIVISSSATTGMGLNIAGGSVTSGSSLKINGAPSGGISAFTGTQIEVNISRTSTNGATLNDTGNFLSLNRNNVENGTGSFNVTGALANLQSNCSFTTGGCTDSSNIINLGQNYASATGAVLNASNAGSGSVISLTQSHSLGSNAAISLNYTGGTATDTLISLQNNGTPKFTVDASGNIVALGTYNTDTINGTTFTFGGASAATISTTGGNALGIDAGGAAAVNIGTGNANAVNISKTGVTTTINGSAIISQLLTANAGLNVSAGNTFTNASSTLNTAVALGNLASGPIGANTATVDIATAFTINPSAVGRSYTVPSPTNTAAGRIIYVSNISGSFSFDIGGVTVPAGANAGFLWNGSAWAASNVSTGASVIGSLNGGTANANGATITGNTLYLQSASATFAGLVDTNNGQVFAGTKSFSSLLTAGAGLTANNGPITMTGNAASSLTTTSGALTLTSAAAATWGTSAGDLTVQAGGTNLNLGGNTSGGVVNIGTVGSVNFNSTVHIADSSAAVQTVIIGSAANNASTTLIQGGNGTTAGSEAIRIVPNTAGAVTIGNTAGAGPINVGVSTVTNTVNIGNSTISAGNTQTINIGTSSTSTGKDVINIGSLNDGSTTTLQAGTGGIVNTLASNAAGAFVLQNNTQSLSSTGQLMTFSAATSSNLLTNPSFENNPITSWAADGAASAPTRDTTQAYNGVASGKVVTTATAGDGIKQNTGALSGTYTVSFYAKLDASSAALSNGITFGLFNGTNETTYASTVLPANTPVVSTGWTRFSATFNSVSTTGTPYFFVKQPDAAAHTFYIDQVQVESGSNASGQGIGTAQINSIISAPLTLQNTVNSTNAFNVFDASGNIVFGVDTLNRKVTVGSNVSFLASHTKYLTLTPEYAGAVLDATSNTDSTCSSANSGTMISGFDSAPGASKQNYYRWNAGVSLSQCYDVVVSVAIPADFASWAGGPTIAAANSSSLANSICLQILNTTGATDGAYGSYSCATPGISIANLSTFATPSSTYLANAGNTMTLKIRMTSNSSSNLTYLGNISIPYVSAY